MSVASQSMRYQVVSAVTWRLVTDLVRRQFERYPLRVLEVHLGKRDSDCIALYGSHDGFPGRPLCHFHRSGVLRIPNPSDKVVSRKENYVEAFLRVADPWTLVDHMEVQMGISPYKGDTLPGTTRPILMLRLIAGLLDRFITSAEVLEARSGWLESKGAVESHMRDDLLLFPDVAASVRGAVQQGASKAEASHDHWLLYLRSAPAEPARLKALLAPQGRLWLPGRDEPVDAWDLFKKHRRKIRPLVHHVEDLLRSG